MAHDKRFLAGVRATLAREHVASVHPAYLDGVGFAALTVNGGDDVRFANRAARRAVSRGVRPETIETARVLITSATK